jgi:hypothetical protein
LELITQETLQGEVIGLNSVKLGLSNDRDLIVIAFKEAKVIFSSILVILPSLRIYELKIKFIDLAYMTMHFIYTDRMKCI